MKMFLYILSTCLLQIISANTVIHGKITPFLNQSSEGVYRFKGWARDGLSFHSYWYQDDPQQKLALGIGKRGQDLQAHFWFFKTNAYELVPKDATNQSKGYKCVEFVDFNYTMEIQGYDHNYLKSMGRFELYEKNETFKAELYMGTALDGVGPLSCVAVIDERDGTYAKLFTVQNIGGASFSEYYLYPRNDSIPAARHFDLPDECKSEAKPQKEYFFKKFNMKGERIDKPKCPECEKCKTCPAEKDCSSAGHIRQAFVFVVLPFLLSFMTV
ncbi:uncharacterized protein LOC130625581 [Hydractinia symbiolongicarpus]|uniref:uncharacterized protein LOC130625581 n=1 Tax=Hydractinia symbiolongicarpus TaxID=13093 RepID=UPI00254BA95F|nr:uncharacterized protein LOC130625581 [Hydractinia symbiolongicarpus]